MPVWRAPSPPVLSHLLHTSNLCLECPVLRAQPAEQHERSAQPPLGGTSAPQDCFPPTRSMATTSSRCRNHGCQWIYCGIPFATPAALASRDGSLAYNTYSATAEPVAAPPHSQQPFLNPVLPPGYSYTGLPDYAGVPSAFQYGPTSYGAGYDDLTQGTAAGDYTKGGCGGSSQAQNKSAGSGPGKGVSTSSSTSGLPDTTGSVYKTQAFDKQGFHAGTPPPFSLPLALGSPGPLAPGAAPGYAPPPFLYVCPPTSSLTHSCYATTCRRMLRVAPVSAASPAPCSPSRKPPNLPTAGQLPF
ncbi:hypothetical protein CB1_000146012 [Camelus ferus]|nr:hypothetical protein CB1_000146012 [Camelus ferus]